MQKHNNQGCECKDFIDSNGWGNCIKTSKGRPMCFVKDPSTSTCKDLVDFPGGPGEKGSFEACEQNCMSILDTRNRFILSLIYKRLGQISSFSIFHRPRL